MRSVVKHYGLKSTGKTRKVGGKRKISLMTGEVVSFDSGHKLFCGRYSLISTVAVLLYHLAIVRKIKSC